jgi:hypothetical protein
MRAIGWLLIGACLAWCGCTAWHGLRAELPARDTVQLDQLVIHSNFEIPANHRLLQEVNALRSDVSAKLGLPMSDEPIHVYLFDDADRFNAFIHAQFPRLPERRAFFVETNAKLSVYAQWGEHVAVDLRHEVTHGYLHSVLPPTLPMWLDEGLAEFFEVPRGQNGYHQLNLDDLLTAAGEGRWKPDIYRLETFKSVGEMSRTEYAESWAWVHMLLETEPSRRQILHGYLLRLRGDAAPEPLSLALRQNNLDDPQLLLSHVRQLAARGTGG